MPPSTPTPHDALFKDTFSQVEHAAGELRHALPPALSARIDFTTLALCPGSYIDEALKETHSDLLFTATLAGRTAFLYVLLEHQSTADPWMPFRLLRYMVRIWEAHLREHPEAKLLPLIVPIVVHHSATGWVGSTEFAALFDVDAATFASIAEHVPRFRFVLDDLSHETDAALRARAMSALARLCLWCLRHAREPRELVDHLRQWLALVRDVRRSPHGPAALGSIWRYILLANEPNERQELVEWLLAVAGDEEKEEIVTAGELLIERGMQKGLQQGRQEGRVEGQRGMLLKQLRARFGTLPDAVVARVEEADLSQLDVWAERILTAHTLVDALGDSSTG